jgi:hypothetical protein
MTPAPRNPRPPAKTTELEPTEAVAAPTRGNVSPRHYFNKASLYCRSYSPLLTRLRTVNPAFLASEIESFLGELKVDHTLRTGFLQAGHLVNGGAESGRRKVNFPPHTTQLPSQSSYSYKGITFRL